MQLQNETIKERTPIKGLLIDWLIIFGTYLFIRVFFALFGLHQNIVILGCCLAVLPYLLGAVYLQKSHKQCPLWLSASAILIPSIVEKIAIYLFGAYLYNLSPINVLGVMEAIKSNASYTNFIKNQSAQNLINLSYLNWTYILSNMIVYNNFPWPSPTNDQKEKIRKTAQAILNARALYTDSNLADLYDPLTMPTELLKAHKANNRAVMHAYGFSIKMSEADCVAELMRMYQKLTKEK